MPLRCPPNSPVRGCSSTPRNRKISRQGLASEADSVIFDLEASVPDAQKAQAREAVMSALNGGMTAWVRISPTHSAHWEDDVSALPKLKASEV